MNGDREARGDIGHYFGTEIDEKWWRRYWANGMLARGRGRYWHDADCFYFLRLLTRTPMAIPLSSIQEFKFGSWHAGQWGGGAPVLKIIWVADGRRLSSGFSLSKDKATAAALLAELKESAIRAGSPASRFSPRGR